MIEPDPRARLSRTSLTRALVRRVLELVCIIGFFTFPLLFVIQTLSDGSRYSAGTSVVTWLLICLISLAVLRRDQGFRTVLKRWKRVRLLRSDRGRRTVRRAAFILAERHGIPADVQIYARTIARHRSCPVEIELSTDCESWRFYRTASGWSERKHHTTIM